MTTIAEYLANLQDALNRLPVDRNPNYLIEQIAKATQVESASTTNTAGDLAHNDAIAALAVLNTIASNTAADKFEFVPIEDSTATVFYNKIDKVAGTVTPVSLNLAPYTPVPPLTLVPPDNPRQTISTCYEAITSNAGNWTIGQQLRRVESWVGNILEASAWIDDDTGAVLSVAPLLGTDVRGENDLTLDTLRQVRDRLGDISDPIANADDGSFGLIPLLKRLLDKLPNIPAATTPTITDRSLVVALSPNSVDRLAANLAVVDVPSAAISAASTSIAILPTFGISYAVNYKVSAMVATSCTVEVQESYDLANWKTIYNFTFSAPGEYASPLMPLIGVAIRYVETPVAGSVTREITRTQSNAPTDYVPTLRYGGYNLNSLALAQMARFKTISISNNSGTLLWLQLFDKALALAGGDVPINGCVYRIPANSTISYGVGDFGADGKFVGVNPRLGISSTFASYTAAALTATAINVEARV